MAGVVDVNKLINAVAQNDANTAIAEIEKLRPTKIIELANTLQETATLLRRIVKSALDEFDETS